MDWEARMAERARERREGAGQVERAAAFVAAEAERRLPPEGYTWPLDDSFEDFYVCLRCGERVWAIHPSFGDRTTGFAEEHTQWHADGEPERPVIAFAAV